MTATYHDAPVSEVDSLSDSDWLDIASNRGGNETDEDGVTTDTDSIVDDDRDGSSSVDAHDVDRWEGFLDGASRASTPPPLPVPAPSSLPSGVSAAALLLSRNNAAAASSPLSRNVLATEEDLAEDERVQCALDQSMVSTLSASRSSTGSAHSRRSSEFRLSFPDPLASSRDSLMNSSYEDVHSSLSGTDDCDDTQLSDAEVTTTRSIPSIPSSGPGSFSTPVTQDEIVKPVKVLNTPIAGKSLRQLLRTHHVPTM
jgi:hypothetical protein